MTKREIILMAGQQLFAKYGPTKTTVEDIIRYAQVAKGTFYKYFPDKGELFLEVAKMETEDFIETVTTAVSSAETAREKLHAYLTSAVHKIQDLENFIDITKHTFPGILPQLHTLGDQIWEKERQIIQGVLDEGVQNRELEISDTRRASYALLIGVGLHHFDAVKMIERLPTPLEEVIDDMVSMLFEGIRVR